MYVALLWRRDTHQLWERDTEQSYISVLPEIAFKIVVLGCGAGDTLQLNSQGKLPW